MKDHFDSVYNHRGVMFAMWHADRYSNNVINKLSDSSLVSILSYISNRKDVWYVANGWLMSYYKVSEDAEVGPIFEQYLMEILEDSLSAEYNLNVSHGYYEYYVKCSDYSNNIGISEIRSSSVE